MKPSERLRKTVHLTAGLLVVVLALSADLLLGRTVDWSVFRVGLLLLGFGFGWLGHIPLPKTISTVGIVGGIGWIMLSLLLLVGELVFRFTGLGVAIDRKAWEAVPIYFRQPMTPYGKASFRRAGPADWEGRVLHERVKQLGIKPNPYADETPVKAHYDRDGFRNPDSLNDWDIACTGDSFTELGYLADQDLFTSVLAEKTGLRVKNLGVSYTGPITQTAYLRDYGAGESVKHWILVYFEGNDLTDMHAEFAASQAAEKGNPPRRKFDGSLIRRLDSMARNIVWRLKGTHGAPNAKFGKSRQPVTVMYAPPNAADIDDQTRDLLADVLAEYTRNAKTLNVTPWLVYVPCKRRVLDGMLEFAPNCPPHLRDWRPTDLAKHVAHLSQLHGIRFVDTTEALREETERTGESIFNSVFDSHLTARGSQIVGETIAAQFVPVALD